MLTWSRDRAGKTIRYTSGQGHKIVRVRDGSSTRLAIYHAYRPGNDIVRLEVNDDGSPFLPEPRIDGLVLPQVRRFSTAAAAKRFLEKEAPEPEEQP